jgi:Ni/Fe-hydrogenase 1 B-type cytochrome subunit
MTSTTTSVPAGMAARGHRYFRRRYVWQWPIRTFHWVNALSITALFLTGLYIANPVLAPAGEAWHNFVMGKVRQIHFAFANVFLINFLWRIYWFWMGNNFTRSGFPMVWKRAWWQDLVRQGLDYLRLQRGHIHLGHNALAGLMYTLFVIALGWAQLVLGFALYSQPHPGGFWDVMVGWVLPLVGGPFRALMWHHLFAWLFVFFSILHVYIVFYDGLQFRNGLVTSIVSGEKFYQDEDIDPKTWLS